MDHELNALIRLDAWIERGEGGSIPMDLLRQRGVEIADPSTLDDDTLASTLRQTIEAVAEIGLYILCGSRSVVVVTRFRAVVILACFT